MMTWAKSWNVVPSAMAASLTSSSACKLTEKSVSDTSSWNGSEHHKFWTSWWGTSWMKKARLRMDRRWILENREAAIRIQWLWWKGCMGTLSRSWESSTKLQRWSKGSSAILRRGSSSISTIRHVSQLSLIKTYKLSAHASSSKSMGFHALTSWKWFGILSTLTKRSKRGKWPKLRCPYLMQDGSRSGS